MQTMKDIHYWASSKKVSEMLSERYSIKKLPCYSQFTNLVGMIDSEELNKIFMEFFCKLVETVAGKTIAKDGKTVCSTANMGKYQSPLHIASAFVVENGITIGQLAAEGKGKEIPCVQELLRLLDITGATVVTDALPEKDGERDTGGGSGLCFFSEEKPKGIIQRCSQNDRFQAQ